MIALVVSIPQSPVCSPKKAKRRPQRTGARSSFGGYGTYTFRKLQWEAENPSATCEQHQAAMRRIACESGV